jgi:class 3 adenylate cyclase
MDITAWLRALRLERYAAAFQQNEITADVLPYLSAEDLKEIGVGPVGDRRRLLTAIASLDAKTGGATNRGVEDASASPAQAGSAEALAAASGGERRQVTVLFSDLVGSTELSTKVDPEDLREFLRVYRTMVTAEIERHRGFLARFLGDGILAYFGYPQAHENAAELAVRSALALVARLRSLPPLAGTRPQIRVGIATGLVVVGDLLGPGEAREHSIVGETPNLASRLQSLANPGSILIAEATRRLVGDLFECRSLGPVAVKGYATPMRFWEVIGEGSVPSRFEALRAGRTPLVGREEELDLLIRRWTQARSGEGLVVLVSGEAATYYARTGV